MRPLRTIRTIPRAVATTAALTTAAVLVMSTALTGCSDSSDTKDGKATSPLLSGPSRTAASGGATTPASGRTTATYTPRSAPGDEALRRTADLLRTRAAAMGLKDARIEVRGGTITVTTPGDTGERLRQLAATAELGFRPVLGSDATVSPELQARFAAYDCKAPLTTAAVSPADPTIACDKAGPPVKYALGAAALTGRDVTSAKAAFDAQLGNGWMVNLELTTAGGAKFAQLTGTLAQQQSPANQIGILLDRTVLSAPSVSQSITGGKVQISGHLTRTSAEDLAAQISSGTLPVELTVSEVTRFPS
ncbi:SecDF P1 head subdomain-containing protein [Streptomyces sp. H39-S7]|uniref:SecDF P1 head subdomain-containing protein n=1 Tax=Streptomyces sp. H39-S7 TaxID=3004357 RepID=UPI0022AEB514|nr:hypothetical protein [Streptomyces sp. H39-S7]MCZ4123771.1 hypothetical protein [Streptomyces sp. H39-S7]